MNLCRHERSGTCPIAKLGPQFRCTIRTLCPAYDPTLGPEEKCCPECGGFVKPVYPLGDTSTGVDFYVCRKCKIALHPETLKKLAQVIQIG